MDRFEQARSEGIEAEEASMRSATAAEAERKAILEKWGADLADQLDLAIPEDADSLAGPTEKHVVQEAAEWGAARLDYTRHGRRFLIQVQARAELDGRLLIGEGAFGLEPPIMRVAVTDKETGDGTDYEYAYGLQAVGHLVTVSPSSFQYLLEQSIRHM